MDDEQIRARNVTPVVQHPVAGSINVMGVPVQLSETRTHRRRGPPCWARIR